MQHVESATIVVLIAAAGSLGLAVGLPALTLFAIGAGAGHSLSGSV